MNERPPSPTEQRRLDRRKEALDELARQVDDGSLTVRQMSEEDKEKYPRKTDRPARGGGGRGRSGR